MVLFAGKVKAQAIYFLDPIKNPQYEYYSPLLDLSLSSGTLLREEKINSSWRNANKSVGLRDAQGNQTLFNSTDWDTTAGQWMTPSNEFIQSFGYDAQNRVTSRNSVVKNDGDVVMVMNRTYSYDANGRLNPARGLDTIFQGSVGIGLVGVDSFVYDANGRMSERIFAREISGMYMISSRMLYTYNANGKLIETLVQDYNSSGMSWEDNERFTYTWDGNNMVVQLKENYNDPMWENSEVDSFFYTGTKITKIVSYQDNSGSWDEGSMELITYNGDKFATLEEYTWDGSDMVADVKTVFNYTGDNFTSAYIYAWTGSDWEADYSQRITVVGSNGIASKSKVNFSIYPNPANDKMTINGLSGNYSLEVFDMNGSKVNAKQIGEQVDVSALTPGVYMLKINAENTTSVKKFVKN